MMAARMTEPPVGASTWASGSQVCTGHMGTLTAKASRKARKIRICSVRPSFKVWKSRLTAFDLFAEWDFDGEKYNFHTDYISHDYERLDTAETLLMFYHGYGVRIIKEGKDDKTALGMRLPFGVSYLMDDPPLDVFGELAPRINVTPSTNFGLDVIIGVRYRFGLSRQE